MIFSFSRFNCNSGPKSNASGPKSLAMASMMQTMMDSSSDSDSESEMRPGPNASKLQMNETVSPVKTTDGPSHATKPSYTGPMSMSSKLNTMMDSSSDSDSGDEIAVVTSSTAPTATTVESTIPTKTQDAPAGVISGPASLASRLNDISDSDSSSDEEIVQAKVFYSLLSSNLNSFSHLLNDQFRQKLLMLHKAGL